MNSLATQQHYGTLPQKKHVRKHWVGNTLLVGYHSLMSGLNEFGVGVIHSPQRITRDLKLIAKTCRWPFLSPLVHVVVFIDMDFFYRCLWLSFC